METENKERLAFRTALDHVLTERGYGAARLLAKVSRIPDSAISDLRSGKKGGTIETLSLLAKALGYSYIDFLKMGMTILDKGHVLETGPSAIIERMREELELQKELIEALKRENALLRENASLRETNGLHQMSVGSSTGVSHQ